ncbi:LOW QUALITY PROTEIN: hypothetical protein U9M48_027448 [Paspalum notatum var. saurae]|uniref:Uncharacterized protein n=1 Tax=Paspalum notatum var. saurae TaxID=547442 RepID=A0AAQ3X033_PASNO
MPPRKPLAASGGKLKKPLTDKQRAAAEQRLAHLRSHLHLRPLDHPNSGTRVLPPPHEVALRALGLLDFALLDLHSAAPRSDLLAPLIAYYDSGNKRSFIGGVRVSVSRHDLTRALSLPSKPVAGAAAPADVDPAAVVAAVMQLLHDHVLLPFQGDEDDISILPQEVAAAQEAVREGNAHRVDWAGLIWGLVEKEILELPKRDDGVCYYGPHLQRLIRFQKPHLFEPLEQEDRGDVVMEASADVEMDEEDGDADVKSKSLEELDMGDGDADKDVRSKSLEESELGNADSRNEGLDELEMDGAVTRNRVMEELDLGDVDARNNNIGELEAVDEDVKSKGLNECEIVDEDVRRKSADESEEVDEDVKGTSLDETNTVDDHANGTDLNGLGLGFVAAEAVPAVHESVPKNDEDMAEAPPVESVDVAGGDAAAVATEEDGKKPLVETVAEEVGIDEAEGVVVETVAVTQEEVVAVAKEVGDEEAEGDEEKDEMGLSLGFNSMNGYNNMEVEEERNIEDLDEDEDDDDDSGNEEDESSEDDAFEVNGEEEMSWRIGDDKADEGMTHCLQRCNTFGGMEFENLNKGEADMRDDLKFDDFSARGSLERMTSSNLLQAMNSIPSSYNVTENVHDLSSGDFLAMGADAHKGGVDLGSGSSYLFGNNGKRHIDDIDGYNGNMQVQEQFPESNQQKRMRHSNSSNISSGSEIFNVNFSLPIQNLMGEASRLYEQKEQEIRNLQFEKQQWSDLLQQKEAIIQSLSSARLEQHNKYQTELRRFEHDLNVMAQLVTAYKKALKQTRACFDKYRKEFPCNKPLYGDVTGGGGLVLSVRELERRRLEEQQQKLALANEMIEKFQCEWFSKIDEWDLSINSLWRRMEGLTLIFLKKAEEQDLLPQLQRNVPQLQGNVPQPQRNVPQLQRSAPQLQRNELPDIQRFRCENDSSYCLTPLPELLMSMNTYTSSCGYLVVHAVVKIKYVTFNSGCIIMWRHFND